MQNILKKRNIYFIRNNERHIKFTNLFPQDYDSQEKFLFTILKKNLFKDAHFWHRSRRVLFLNCYRASRKDMRFVMIYMKEKRIEKEEQTAVVRANVSRRS